jgi:hypothetical protein
MDQIGPGADRRTIKAQQRAKLTTDPYDAGYLAHKNSISLEQARELIRRIGKDREKLNTAGAKLFWKSKRPATEAPLLVPNTLTAIAFERPNDCLPVREVHDSD